MVNAGLTLPPPSNGQWDTFTLVNPVSIETYNGNGQVTADIQATVGLDGGSVQWASASSADTEITLPSGVTPQMLFNSTDFSGAIGLPPQTSYTAWTTYQYSHTHLSSKYEYYSIPSSGTGTAGQNYLATKYGYEDDSGNSAAVGASPAWMGRRIWTETPDGTITWNVLDAQGNVISTWMGTCDVPSTDYNGDGTCDWHDFEFWLSQHPTATQGPPGTNMVMTSSNTYNADSNVTSTTRYVDSNPADNRTSQYGYDWRDRQTYLVNPTDIQEGMTTYTMTTFDNQDEATDQRQYLYVGSAGGIAAALAAATADPPAPLNPAHDLLLAWTHTAYDTAGQVYESRVYNVAPTTSTSPAPGTVGDYLPTDTWHDGDGNVVATRTGAGPIEKSAYDGMGNLVQTYTCAVASPNSSLSYEQATRVQNTDPVVEQTQSWYDAAGEQGATVDYQALPGSAATGALSAATSYATGSATWYDAIGREVEQTNYGHERTTDATHYFFDGSSQLRLTNGPPTVAVGSPPVPDSSSDYIVSETVYAAPTQCGQVVQTVNNAGIIDETITDPLGRTVRRIQNSDGNVSGSAGSANIAETDTAQDITTDYQYDSFGRLATMTAYDAKGAGKGVMPEATLYLYNSALDASLQTIVVAPDSTDLLAADGNGDWTFTTNAGDHTTTTYDNQEEVATTTDPRGVTHSYSYDALGRQVWDRVTSFGTSGVVDQTVNEIYTVYDPLGRAWWVMSLGQVGGAETILNQVQNSYDGWGNVVQQWQAVSGAVATGTTPSVQYTYQDGASGGGVGQYVRLSQVAYPNGDVINYNYVSPVDQVMSRVSSITVQGATTGTVAYSYLGTGTVASIDYQEPQVKLDYSSGNFAALDRFGRVVSQTWTGYGANNSGTLDGYGYAYNAAGDRLTQTNQTDSALSETYGYDSLDRLISANRADNTFQEWTLDSLGNFTNFNDNGTSQSRTTDAANEIATINSSTATSGYDLAGNMNVTPQPRNTAAAYNCVYDAWNRLVQVSVGSSIVAQYAYDGSAQADRDRAKLRGKYSDVGLVRVLFRVRTCGDLQRLAGNAALSAAGGLSIRLVAARRQDAHSAGRRQRPVVLPD